MIIPINVFPQAGQQRGVSLVELMIGMLLGLILLGGVILVFTSSNEVNRNRMAMSAISDNARFTLEHMNRHLRMADPGSIVLSGDTLDATLINGNRIAYTLNAGDGEITFDEGDGDVTLVDGINDWNLLFGVGDRNDGTLGYQTVAASSDEIWSVRVNLVLEDPSSQGNPLVIANNQVGATIALRNPLLLAIADSEPVQPSGGGQPIVPVEPSDTPPPAEDGTGDDAPVPLPVDDADPEAGQPIPDQPVACEVDSVLVNVHHQNAELTTQKLVVGQGAFLGCADSGKNRRCEGKATSRQSFSMLLVFTGPGNQGPTRRTVDFACVQ